MVLPLVITVSLEWEVLLFAQFPPPQKLLVYQQNNYEKSKCHNTLPE